MEDTQQQKRLNRRNYNEMPKKIMDDDFSSFYPVKNSNLTATNKNKKLYSGPQTSPYLQQP